MTPILDGIGPRPEGPRSWLDTEMMSRKAEDTIKDEQ